MFRELLVREFAPYGSLTAQQIDALEAHYNLLTQWNARLNLTRIESVEEAVRLHYCESLFVGAKLPPQPLRIVDVGSGAGFPGIPIAILRPECTVTVVESHQRKGVFLREASRNLKNVRVVTDRAENLRAEYDWLVSRAVSPHEVRKLKLANNFAILIGSEEIPGFERREPMPWGTGRYLVFHVKHPC
ncbi:MAG: 16S rRNA (guanine(527)-N(7))-methyltransferase RsmG [Acidobacteriia bacterium]|nr:16S rRNA (guanine(527)-N(7))-methyltransferase RsmG [Terriglobia bacterium]